MPSSIQKQTVMSSNNTNQHSASLNNITGPLSKVQLCNHPGKSHGNIDLQKVNSHSSSCSETCTYLSADCESDCEPINTSNRKKQLWTRGHRDYTQKRKTRSNFLNGITSCTKEVEGKFEENQEYSKLNRGMCNVYPIRSSSVPDKKCCHTCPGHVCNPSLTCVNQLPTPTIVNEPKHPMKFKHSLQGVPTFSGEGNIDVITFINEIEFTFSLQPEIWFDKLKIQGCKTKLEGLALRIAYSSMSTHTTWTQVKYDLLKLFGPMSHVELLIIKLQGMKRAQHQEWVHYYAQLKEISNIISYLDPTFDTEKQTFLALIGSVDNVLKREILRERAKGNCTSLQVLRLIMDDELLDSHEQNYVHPGMNTDDINTKLLENHDQSYLHPKMNMNNITNTHSKPKKPANSPQIGRLNKFKEKVWPQNLPYRYKSPTNLLLLEDANLPLPCIRCREWGHYESTCNGPGNNGIAGKRYPPTYCFNCETWTWHSSTSQYCPMKRGNYTNNQ